MEQEKKEREPINTHKLARSYLSWLIVCAIVAYTSTINLPYGDPIWPMESHYLFPNVAMIGVYIFGAFFVGAVIAWVLKGDK